MIQSEGDPATAYEGALAAHQSTADHTRLVSVNDEGQHGVYLAGPSPCVERIGDAFLFNGVLPAAGQGLRHHPAAPGQEGLRVQGPAGRQVLFDRVHGRRRPVPVRRTRSSAGPGSRRLGCPAADRPVEFRFPSPWRRKPDDRGRPGDDRGHDLVVVIDFGAQYAQLIARRVREAKVYSEIMPHTASVAEIVARRPKAIILSGGPQSVYAAGAPQVDPALFDAGRPGVRHLLRLPGDGPGPRRRRRPDRAERVRAYRGHGSTSPGTLLAGLPDSLRVWMSHGDSVAAAPAGFTALASSAGAPIAAFEDAGRGFAGVQWHPEVLHSQAGQRVLEQFLYDIAGCSPDWTRGEHRRGLGRATSSAQVGDKHIICGLSGGVDSAVAAALVQRAVGRPAHLRLRRPRPAAQGRGRAGGAGLRRRDRRRPEGGRRVRASSSTRWPA